MSQQIINVGATANDGTGDTLRLSQQKANLNFTELYGSKLDSVVAGNNVSIDNTDPLNPIISTTGGSGGGGASVNYYINGGTSQGTIGGNAYLEMSKTAVIGTGVDFTIATNGYIANFITDVADPSLLKIPAGNWNLEYYFSSSSAGGSPSFYTELYKYDGATFTLIATNSAVPKTITNGTAIEPYLSSLAVPETVLALTDRLAIRIYVNNSSKTITLHTQDSHLGQLITTFTTGLVALNGLTAQVQSLATGTSGTDFTISSATDTHTFNLPTASATKRGALSSTDWSAFNGKQGTLTLTTTGTSGAATLISNTLNIPQYSGGGSSAWIDYSATSTIVGWSSFTDKNIYYRIINDHCFVQFGLSGTSNSTLITFTLPFNNTSGFDMFAPSGYSANNSANVTTPGRLALGNASNVVNSYRDMGFLAWNASGIKAIVGQFSFKIN